MKFIMVLFLLFMIPTPIAFAQSGDDFNWSEGVSVIAIATAVMTAIGLIISQYHNHKQLQDQNNTKYLELIKEFSKQFSELLKEGDALNSDDPEKNQECITWTFRFLEVLDMIAYIKQHEQIPSDIVDYFHQGWFELGKSLMQWFDESVRFVYPDLRPSRISFKFLDEYIDKKEIPAMNRSEFPKALEKQFPRPPLK